VSQSLSLGQSLSNRSGPELPQLLRLVGFQQHRHLANVTAKSRSSHSIITSRAESDTIEWLPLNSASSDNSPPVAALSAGGWRRLHFMGQHSRHRTLQQHQCRIDASRNGGARVMKKNRRLARKSLEA